MEIVFVEDTLLRVDERDVGIRHSSMDHKKLPTNKTITL